MSNWVSGHEAPDYFMLPPVAVFTEFEGDWLPILVKDTGILNIGLCSTLPGPAGFAHQHEWIRTC